VNKIHLLFCFSLFANCNPSGDKGKFAAGDLDVFLEDYNEKYQTLSYEANKARWRMNIHIVSGDTMNAFFTRQAEKARADFLGSREVIKKTRFFMEEKVHELTSMQKKQLEAIMYKAADKPEIVSDLVEERINLETSQEEKLFGFNFQINGVSVTTNEIDRRLKEDQDLSRRLKAWDASKEVGKVLKPGMFELRDLRNKTVQALGYSDFFAYQVSDYGMSVEGMLKITNKLVREIWPLYREIHTHIRYKLAEKYNQEVPEMIPAHWLPNRWGQDWSALLNLKGVGLESSLKKKDTEWLIQQSEAFYVSMGFEKLPESFYEKSSLYPVPTGADYKKNNHASAWHMDLSKDVRCLMSVIPNAQWYETTHHELGHIYYFLAYSRPEVPIVLRTGANRAFHEAVGSLMGLAAMQQPFLSHLDLIEENEPVDEIRDLFKEALNYIVFIPWSAGVMTEFEHALYRENLPSERVNEFWWSLKLKYQGIIPPFPRGEEYCDPVSKTHITNDAAQYYDYALSFALLFQLHQHIAEDILKQNPRSTNYFGKQEIGNFLEKILKPGKTRKWRGLLKETIQEDISSKAMIEYFNPLMNYLKEKNQGKRYTLPDSPELFSEQG